MKRVAAVFLSMLFLHAAVFGADVFVANHNGTTKLRMQPYGWTAGCAPTSSAITLSYWDFYGPDGNGGNTKCTQWGRLIQYYIDQPAMQSFVSNNGTNYQWQNANLAYARPNLIHDLADAMHTAGDTGNTASNYIARGITVVAAERGYAGARNWATAIQGNSANNWTWDLMTKEIDNDKPVVWCEWDPDTGHCISVWGYTQSSGINYLINYDTWDEMRHDWNYVYYLNDSATATTGTELITVHPQDPGMTSDVELTVPDGGRGVTLVADTDTNIQWIQFGADITAVNLYYSANGGVDWTAIVSGLASVVDQNTYTWHIPAGLDSGRMRVRIEGTGTAGIYGEDGTRQNFTVTVRTCTPTRTITRTRTATRTITPTRTCTNTRVVTQTRTPVITASLTPAVTQTQAVTPTETGMYTATAVFTNTNSPTPATTNTATFTRTGTPTRTNSATPSATRTATYTRTLQATVTQTFTAVNTYTTTFTATVTPTFTHSTTLSATNTRTQTNTFTPTVSITRTATASSTVTFTCTYTTTFTPTCTRTMTYTTATPSMTATIVDRGADSFVIVMYPNPAKDTVSIKYYAPDGEAAVRVGIYSVSFRLIRKYDLVAGPKGDNIAEIALENTLSNGIYYLRYEYESKIRKNRQTKVLVVLK